MRNKIACSAERLGLLDPQMIESVAEANAFHIGRQYMAENRVRIVEADDAQISSAVIGNSGLYEQTIRLKDGHLISKCSCALPEEPMCRHCIAVLLEYHRWTQPRQSQKGRSAKAAVATEPDSSDAEITLTQRLSAPDVKLSEVMLFVEWLEPAMRAIEKGTEIPDSPRLGPGNVATWIANIRNLEDRRRAGEEILMNLESEMRDREAYLGRLSQQLQASLAETKAAHASLQALQREAARYQEILSRVAGLVDEMIGYEGQLRTVASELLSKSTHLETLTGSFHELADSLALTLKQAPLKCDN